MKLVQNTLPNTTSTDSVNNRKNT